MPHNLCYEFGPYHLNLSKRVLTCGGETISLMSEEVGDCLDRAEKTQAAEKLQRLLDTQRSRDCWSAFKSALSKFYVNKVFG